MSAVEKFPTLLSEAEEESSAVPPCFSDEGINVRNSILSSIDPGMHRQIPTVFSAPAIQAFFPRALYSTVRPHERPSIS